MIEREKKNALRSRWVGMVRGLFIVCFFFPFFSFFFSLCWL